MTLYTLTYVDHTNYYLPETVVENCRYCKNGIIARLTYLLDMEIVLPWDEDSHILHVQMRDSGLPHYCVEITSGNEISFVEDFPEIDMYGKFVEIIENIYDMKIVDLKITKHET